MIKPWTVVLVDDNGEVARETFTTEAEADTYAALSDRGTNAIVFCDKNAFAIIAAVSLSLKNAGLRDKAVEWTTAAMNCGSYDALLQLAFDYVDVR